jgi:hypothetical protein
LLHGFFLENDRPQCGDFLMTTRKLAAADHFNSFCESTILRHFLKELHLNANAHGSDLQNQSHKYDSTKIPHSRPSSKKRLWLPNTTQTKYLPISEKNFARKKFFLKNFLEIHFRFSIRLHEKATTT